MTPRKLRRDPLGRRASTPVQEMFIDLTNRPRLRGEQASTVQLVMTLANIMDRPVTDRAAFPERSIWIWM